MLCIDKNRRNTVLGFAIFVACRTHVLSPIMFSPFGFGSGLGLAAITFGSKNMHPFQTCIAKYCAAIDQQVSPIKKTGIRAIPEFSP